MPEKYDFDDLWDYGDPAGTAEKFRALLPAAEAGGDAEYHAQLLTQLARTQGLQRKFEEGHALLDGVEKLLGSATPVARIRYLLERGRVFNSSKKVEQARPLFLEAWEQAEAAGEDFYAVDAAHMLGIVEKGAESLAWNENAIAHATQSKSERARGWLGSLLNNTAWTYHDLGEFDKALDLFQQAQAFREEQGNAETIRIAKWCVGRCLRSLGWYDEALAIQNALLVEAEIEGEPHGYTDEELGELLLVLGREDEARSHFAAAYAELSQDAWLVDNEAERVERLRTLGSIEQ